jgi:hypothetical protein
VSGSDGPSCSLEVRASGAARYNIGFFINDTSPGFCDMAPVVEKGRSKILPIGKSAKNKLKLAKA